MKYKLIFVILAILSLVGLTSCFNDYNRKQHFQELIDEKDLDYLNYKDFTYFYYFTSGFEDKVGIKYFVFEFESEPTDFLNQFSSDDENNFREGPNESFESMILTEIDNHIGKKFDDIPSQYKLNFENKYMYSHLPMVYYRAKKQLCIIDLIRIQ